MRSVVIILCSSLALAACEGGARSGRNAVDEPVRGAAVEGTTGLRTLSFPSQDPGPPLYARVSTVLNQIFHDDQTLAIPIYREPDCIPPDFNLLDNFHIPDDQGPGAFGCPLLVEGTLLIEPDAPMGTFPFQVVTRGPAQVWFVPYPDFQGASADGDFTIAELLALSPLRGRAEHFHEMLHPRMENHHVVITSQGLLEDGRRFQFNVNHPGDRTSTLEIRIQ